MTKIQKRVLVSLLREMQARVDTLQDLINLLAYHGIDVLKYGQGTSKTLEQLLKEVREGESSLLLSEGSLIRTTSVLFIAVGREEGRVLVEANQISHKTPDSEEWSRQRNVVLLASELLPNEDMMDAVYRAIDQELGINARGAVVPLITRTTDKGHSQLYPDLLCSYSTIKVKIQEQSLIRRIPDGYTFTENFDNGEPRETATWKWI